MITIRVYYKATNNYELYLEMTEEEYLSLSSDDRWELIHNKLANGEGYTRTIIGEENYGILYIKNFLGEFEHLFEEED